MRSPELVTSHIDSRGLGVTVWREQTRRERRLERRKHNEQVVVELRRLMAARLELHDNILVAADNVFRGLDEGR